MDDLGSSGEGVKESDSRESLLCVQISQNTYRKPTLASELSPHLQMCKVCMKLINFIQQRYYTFGDRGRMLGGTVGGRVGVELGVSFP